MTYWIKIKDNAIEKTFEHDLSAICRNSDKLNDLLKSKDILELSEFVDTTELALEFAPDGIDEEEYIQSNLKWHQWSYAKNYFQIIKDITIASTLNEKNEILSELDFILKILEDKERDLFQLFLLN
jgi:hypothetical protein